MQIPSIELSSDELRDWAKTPQMNWLIEVLNVSAKTIEAHWTSGAYTGKSAEETAQLNAKALGAGVQLRNVIHFLEQVANGDIETNPIVGAALVG